MLRVGALQQHQLQPVGVGVLRVGALQVGALQHAPGATHPHALAYQLIVRLSNAARLVRLDSDGNFAVAMTGRPKAS